MKRLVQEFALVLIVCACGVGVWFGSARAATINTSTCIINAPALQTDAAALYSKHCATCHGKDGQAHTFKGKLKHARDLTDATWQTAASDERIFNSITAGREKMPAFGKKLSKPEIESLVEYVRRLKK